MKERIILINYHVLQHKKFYYAFYRCFSKLLPNYEILPCQVPDYIESDKVSDYVWEWLSVTNLENCRYVFFVDSFYDPRIIQHLKKNSIRTVLLIHGSLFWRDQVYEFDYSFLHSRNMYDKFYKEHRDGSINNIHYMPLFLDEKQDFIKDGFEKKYRSVFLGSLTGNRIDVWKKGKELFRANDIYFPRQESHERGEELYLSQDDVIQLYNESSSGISLIREQTELPLKTFEIPAYNIPLFTDANEYLLKDILEIDEEVICFDSLVDMVDMIIEVTNNSVHSEFISNNAMKRVYKEHLAIHRCRNILDILEMEYVDVDD